jgi:hypothetical protein
MSILDLVSQQIDDRAIASMSQNLGVDAQTTQTAVSAALPMLVGALAKNTQQSGGAQSLLSALDRDHDGSVLDDVVGFLGQGNAQSIGGSILGHVLGGRQQNAQTAIGKVSGMNQQTAGQLLAMLAPLVLGALSKQRQSNGLDADGLAGALNQDRQRVEQQNQGVGSLLSAVLDKDGDGDISDELLQMGGSLLGGLLGGRKR